MDPTLLVGHARRGCRRFGRLAGLLMGCAVAGGCASLADRITRPHDTPLFEPEEQLSFERHLGVVRDSLVTPAGVRIGYRIVPAAERGMHVEFERVLSDESFNISFDIEWSQREPEPLPTRGTVVLLHGWNMDGSSMLPWALALSERGYRGIVVDLRNHGMSSPAPLGFGPREAGDIVVLVDTLQRRGRIQPPLYLLGVSYGAATALFAEPALRERIDGIVAMAPFGSAAAAIDSMLAAALDRSGGSLDAWLTRMFVAWRYDEPDEIGRAIAEVGARLGIDLDRIDTAAPLARSHTCTLLLHGAKDEIIPVAVARQLARAGPHVEYVEVPGHRHVTLPLRIDWLTDPVAGWLGAASRGSGCPQFQLPVDPAFPDLVEGASASVRSAGGRAADGSGRG